MLFILEQGFYNKFSLFFLGVYNIPTSRRGLIDKTDIFCASVAKKWLAYVGRGGRIFLKFLVPTFLLSFLVIDESPGGNSNTGRQKKKKRSSKKTLKALATSCQEFFYTTRRCRSQNWHKLFFFLSPLQFHATPYFSDLWQLYLACFFLTRGNSGSHAFPICGNSVSHAFPICGNSVPGAGFSSRHCLVPTKRWARERERQRKGLLRHSPIERRPAK